MQQFTIYGHLPSLNEIIKSAKKHFTVYSNMKRMYTKRVSKSVDHLEPIKTPATFHIIYFMKNKKKDPDNIAVAKKFIFDGLIEAGKIPNDGWKEIASWHEEFKVDKNNERIEVYINE